MGLDVTTPPNLNSNVEKIDRSRSRSKSPQNVQSTSTVERRKRKKKDSRWKNDPNWRFRKLDKDRRSKKMNENDDAAREIAEEEAIDGALREIAEFVRVEANCDDDGIEFDIEETTVIKDNVIEAEDERSVTDTDPPPEETADVFVPPPEQMSGAENEEPVEHQSESDGVIVKDNDDKLKEGLERQIEETEMRGILKRKEKKHKKHKKHKKQRSGEDDINSD
ncbi:hypothetical protein DICVIV_06489, partial [Dictyocaulus viviparus]